MMPWSAANPPTVLPAVLAEFFFLITLLVLCMVYDGRPLIFLHAASARDTITPDNPIRDVYNEYLLSASNIFKLGFFAFHNDQGAYDRYLGISYYNSIPENIVWVANRDRPLPPNGILVIAADGNLKLTDASGNSTYFSTGLNQRSSSPNNYKTRTVKLHDSGNLVLFDDDIINPSVVPVPLWQSFQNPTDTFLPGMIMDEKINWTSWKKLTDPAPGDFTFQKVGGANSTYRYIIRKRAAVYWRSDELSSIFDARSKQILVPFSSLITNESHDGRRVRGRQLLRMSYSGELQYLIDDNYTGNWSLIWSAPESGRCGVYNECGNFGICNVNGRPVCKCLPGFEPSSPIDWDAEVFGSGCKAKTSSCYAEYTYVNLKLKDTVPAESPPVQTSDDEACKILCDCQSHCTAYSYATSNGACFISTSELKNLQEDPEGPNLSIRVAKADIEPTARNCEPCGANIIPYPLSTAQNCGDPMYYNFRCNHSTGQLYFGDGDYNVTNVNPDKLSFIIHRTKTECDARNFKPLQLPYNINRSWCEVQGLAGNSGDHSHRDSYVEIIWDQPLAPPCNSSQDCKYWPNSDCKTTAPDGSRSPPRCFCSANYQWDALKLNCTSLLQGTGMNYTPSATSRPLEKRSSFMLVPIISSVLVLVLVVLLCIGSYIWYKRRKQRRENRKSIGKALHLYDTERRVKTFIDSGDFKDEDKKGIDVPFLDFESILAATNHFSDANKLGQGGFGPVYKGVFPGGQEIAVKRLSSHSGQGLEEFKNEVVLIAKLQHRNLVRLLGYCVRGDEKILAYEFMQNRSLDAFIFDKTLSMSLDWGKRFDIILGIARGLLYLHQDSRLRIIHRDLKTSNILLDEEMNPKISDFGLARIFGRKQTEASTSRVVGTYGYMAPEYALDGLFSIKSDVFSFGVIVLEIVSGKRNTGFYQSQLASNLLGYVWQLWKEEKALDLMDRSLLESNNSGEVLKCITVGLLCVQEDHSDRPTMPNVLYMLGSETATLPTPKEPAFIAKQLFSNSPPSKSETLTSVDLTVSAGDGR